MRLKKSSRRLTRKKVEFDKIAEIQQTLLPLQPPNIPGLNIAVSHIAQEKAGGDYFDFLPLEKCPDDSVTKDG